MEDTIIAWLQDWYQSQCNGDWEHSFGIKIDTIDNPGWAIQIDLTETFLESYIYDSGLVENSITDWYCYKFENAKYIANGDSTKLEFLLGKFKETINSLNR